jgi:Uma2 family endonuclease
VRLIEGKRGGFTELQGSPDMVLEILSDSSQHKDKHQLRQAYWEADIPEYWLVDARTEPLQFDVLRHTARGYVAVRKQQGWVKSRFSARRSGSASIPMHWVIRNSRWKSAKPLCVNVLH